jgi:hypothetical protein
MDVIGGSPYNVADWLAEKRQPPLDYNLREIPADFCGAAQLAAQLAVQLVE